MQAGELPIHGLLMILKNNIIETMNNKHRRTLEDVCLSRRSPGPTLNPCSLRSAGWFEEGNGSRVRVALSEKVAIFHRPHPQRETDKGAVVSVRRFLENAGVTDKPPVETEAPSPRKESPMNKLSNYKGYEAVITFIDPDSDTITGEVLGIDDLVHFQGQTPAQLQQAFHDSVDDYLAFCGKLGKAPARPFSGKVALRLSPEAHGRAAAAARQSGKSLNAWLGEAIARAL